MWRATTDGLLDKLKKDPRVQARVADLERSVRKKDLSPDAAAQEIIDLFLDRKPDPGTTFPGAM